VTVLPSSTHCRPSKPALLARPCRRCRSLAVVSDAAISSGEAGVPASHRSRTTVRGDEQPGTDPNRGETTAGIQVHLHTAISTSPDVAKCGVRSWKVAPNVSTPSRRGSCMAGDRLVAPYNLSPKSEGLAMRVLVADACGYSGAASFAILHGAGCEVGGE